MLTQKQQEILDYIREYQMQYGNSPTIEEMKHHFGFSSLNAIFKHLKSLQTKGYIEKEHKARGIKLLSEVRENFFSPNEVQDHIPFLGNIPAGNTTLTESIIDESLSVSSFLLPEKKEGVFLLKVTGNSINTTGVLEGDIVVVDTKKIPRDQDIVVALVDGENTLKVYEKRNGIFHLVPRSTEEKYQEIIPVHECIIQGVVTASFRHY